ncbi:MAG: iron-containing alcohol dehydrogenase [Spartobacteria bacterium]|nr:iron-containing alcohol dehydrogenase [Spartobacteria bacterium]
MKETRIEDKAYQAIEDIRSNDLLAPKTIVFGSHKLRELGELSLPYARRSRAMVIMGARSARKSGLSDRIELLLKRYVVEMIPYYGVRREPTSDMVADGVARAREMQPSLIIGAGGGSVIDFAKAVAALATNEGGVEDYLEGVGRGLALKKDPLPMIAVPTNAGTGAEMTKNAVICSPAKGYKKSMRDERMIPTVALIDPELSLHLPSHVVACGGMDAVTQLIESCISRKRTPETSKLARDGLRNVQLALSVAYEDADNLMARERLGYIGMLSGVCLANSGLAMAHGVAAGLGALFDVPHGLACGILLPYTLRYNRDACETELKDALAAFMNQVTPNATTIDDGIAAVESLGRWLQIPPNLKYLRLSGGDVERLAEASMGSSMSGNPIEMTPPMIADFLKPLT